MQELQGEARRRVDAGVPKNVAQGSTNVPASIVLCCGFAGVPAGMPTQGSMLDLSSCAVTTRRVCQDGQIHIGAEGQNAPSPASGRREQKAKAARAVAASKRVKARESVCVILHASMLERVFQFVCGGGGSSPQTSAWQVSASWWDGSALVARLRFCFDTHPPRSRL